MGLEHPFGNASDMRGFGRPGIMWAQETLVDKPYTLPGKPILDPAKRIVTTLEILMLERILQDAAFDAQGRASIGSLTHNYQSKLL